MLDTAPLQTDVVRQPRLSAWRQRLAGWPLDVALLLALAAIAGWVRWPDLYTLPALTDEATDILLALEAWRNGEIPLANVSPYIGPFTTWGLMLAFAIGGPSPTIGRTLIFIAGCATVALTYLLGRRLGGRWVGVIAGALLVPNVVHVLVISHIAWANCLTPLLSTATLLVFVHALHTRRVWLMPAVGLLGGLTLQTHPSVAPLLLALGLALLLHPAGRGWLLTRWTPLALGAFVVAYLPLIVYNIQRPLLSLYSANDKPYAYRPVESVTDYVGELTAMLTQLVRCIASVMEEPASLARLAIQPQVAPLLALLAVGVVVAWRAGQPTLPLVLIVSPLVTALFGGDHRWLPANAMRYLGPLWPVAFVLIGLGAVAAGRWLMVGARWLAQAANRQSLLLVRWPALAGLALLIAGPGLYGPWQAIEAYRAWYVTEPRLGDANTFLYALGECAPQWWPGETVWVDRELWNDGLVDGGNVWMAVTLVLETNGVPTEPLPREAGLDLKQARSLVGDGPALLVLPHHHAFRLSEQGAHLTPLVNYRSGRHRTRGAWAVYRLSPQPMNAPLYLSNTMASYSCRLPATQASTG